MNKVDHGTNDRRLLARVLGPLHDAGFSPLVFGGWAQELLQLVPPRPHADVDLLLLADSFSALDQFMPSAESHGWSQIKAKRFAQPAAVPRIASYDRAVALARAGYWSDW